MGLQPWKWLETCLIWLHNLTIISGINDFNNNHLCNHKKIMFWYNVMRKCKWWNTSFVKPCGKVKIIWFSWKLYLFYANKILAIDICCLTTWNSLVNIQLSISCLIVICYDHGTSWSHLIWYFLIKMNHIVHNDHSLTNSGSSLHKRPMLETIGMDQPLLWLPSMEGSNIPRLGSLKHTYACLDSKWCGLVFLGARQAKDPLYCIGSFMSWEIWLFYKLI